MEDLCKNCSEVAECGAERSACAGVSGNPVVTANLFGVYFQCDYLILEIVNEHYTNLFDLTYLIWFKLTILTLASVVVF